MNKKSLLTGLSLVLLAGPALAFHCPADMQKIDAALAANPPLSQDQLAQVRQLRVLGEQYHRAGQHQQSVATLGRAMRILSIQ